ncbi:unnamed protein product [Microthlaspi erraticum]|uniref:Integrase catalytic domain-containing protein n=1 Tax=Microthlaspi erraticum TaxID=1685480 RepID=A0A6D2LCW0_9BRAS|nr:unnamed protein product [Microthlaspi erraticum]
MCVLDWGGHWAYHLSLVEFPYNNSFQASIGMSPFEALYGRSCRTPLCWIQVGESSMYGATYVQETTEKVRIVRLNMKEAQDRQKSYADRLRRELAFQVGVTFHKVFHVSMLRKCLHLLEELVPKIHEDLRPYLTVPTVSMRILERRDKVLQNKRIPLLRVLWDCSGLGISGSDTPGCKWATVRAGVDLSRKGVSPGDQVGNPGSRVKKLQPSSTWTVLSFCELRKRKRGDFGDLVVFWVESEPPCCCSSSFSSPFSVSIPCQGECVTVDSQIARFMIA